MKIIFRRCIRGSDYSSKFYYLNRSCRSEMEAFFADYESDFSQCWSLDCRSSDYWSLKNWKCIRR